MIGRFDLQDTDVTRTVTNYDCKSSVNCQRDWLFGLPFKQTGIKRRYMTNRQRSQYILRFFVLVFGIRLNTPCQFSAIRFAANILLTAYGKTSLQELRRELSKCDLFDVGPDDEYDKQFAHVHYRYLRTYYKVDIFFDWIRKLVRGLRY